MLILYISVVLKGNKLLKTVIFVYITSVAAFKSTATTRRTLFKSWTRQIFARAKIFPPRIQCYKTGDWSGPQKCRPTIQGRQTAVPIYISLLFELPALDLRFHYARKLDPENEAFLQVCSFYFHVTCRNCRSRDWIGFKQFVSRYFVWRNKACSKRHFKYQLDLHLLVKRNCPFHV